MALETFFWTASLSSEYMCSIGAFLRYRRFDQVFEAFVCGCNADEPKAKDLFIRLTS